MRRTILMALLCLLASAACYAQNKPRVVVYRKDGWGTLIKKAHVWHDDSIIHSFKHKFVLIYDADKANGAYAWGYRPFRAHTIVKEAAPNTLTLVEIKLKWKPFYGVLPHIDKVSLERFTRLYNRKKKIRERLAAAGYKSVAELVSGYEINQK